MLHEITHKTDLTQFAILSASLTVNVVGIVRAFV
jgi:hypothetical protein